MSKPEYTNNRLGTFAGVFTPSILTILGIILFLRLGYVTGSSGLKHTLIIICIANLISVLTSFSLAAIATNIKVKGGGDYYLISRTLGVEFGGAIGIVLFLAQSVSIAFYCIGFGEAVAAMTSFSAWGYLPQMIALAALLLLFILAWLGADVATRFQFVVMTFLGAALVSFYAGGFQKWDSALLASGWTQEHPAVGFWMLFAIFFPAVTGFTQGVSMSGDLEDAGKSLPAGTFLAVGLSILIYFSAAVVFTASNSLDTLAGDYGAMKKTAYFGFFIDAGVIAATLSSAMASFLGAPRILQSLSSDKIFPFLNMFAKGVGPASNPRRGVLLSLIIAVGIIALGQLDLIARIVSMFFLISYGLLNYATYFEAAASSPSFRPRFKWFHRYVSLGGFLVCAAVMLAIDFRTGLTAAAILLALFQYLKRRPGPSRWADSQRSYHLQQIRSSLIEAQKDIEHPRDWRPYILALSNTPEHRSRLLSFAGLIEGGSGMTTAVEMIHGTGMKMIRLREKALRELGRDILPHFSHIFPLVISTMDIETGLPALLQSYGIGTVKANTVLLSWTEVPDSENSPDYRRYLRLMLQAGCNIVLLDTRKKSPAGSEKKDPAVHKRIDVWWKADDSSRLLLLLAYLVTRNREWRSAEIRLMAFHYDRDNDDIMAELSATLEDIRITATPSVVLCADAAGIISHSSEADIVFLPMILKDNAPVLFSGEPVEPVMNALQQTVLVMAARTIDLDAEPEAGKIQELTQIYDALQHAEKRAALAEKEAIQAAEAARKQMESINLPDEDKDLLQKLNEALETRKTALAARQKAAREQAKLDQATREAEEHGIPVEK